MIARYWKQFIFTMIIILGIVFTTWLLARNSINRYSQTMNRNLLEQVKNTVNMKLVEVNNTSAQMSFAKNLSILIRSDDLFSHDMAAMTYAYEADLDDYSMYNQYIVLNFVVFFKSGYVIMPNIGQDLVSFSSSFQDPLTRTVMDIPSFNAYLFEKNNHVGAKLIYRQNNKDIEVLPFIKWVGGSSKDNAGAIVILIDSGKLTDLLNKSVTTSKSLFAITDPNGIPILANREMSSEEKEIVGLHPDQTYFEQNLSDGRMFFVNKAEFNNWRYVLISDISEINSDLNELMFLIILVSVLSIIIVVGALISTIIKSQSLLMPIYNIMKMDDTQKYSLKKDDIYAYLKNGINQLQNDKDYLKKTLDSQLPVVREVLLNNILKGEIFDAGDIRLNLKKLGFEPQNDLYCVAVVNVNPCEEKSIKRISVDEAKNIIKSALKHFASAVLTCDLNKYDIALIMNLPSREKGVNNRDFISNILTSLEKLFSEKYPLRLIITVGGIYERQNGISRSYGEAKSLQGMELMETGSNLVWYDDIDYANDMYYYPPELETRLINTIKSGNKESVTAVVKEIFDINLKEKKVSNDVMMAFLYDFYGSILKALTQKNENPALRNEIYKLFASDYEKIGSLEFQQTFLNYVYILCDNFGQNQKSHNEVLSHKIKEYIMQHYGETTLSLTSVADEFHLSSGYLSIFFKEQVGESFSDYLMRIRLEKAKTLLLTTHLTVSDITNQTGYASPNSFCRAFKRNYGVSALELKNSAIEENDVQ